MPLFSCAHASKHHASILQAYRIARIRFVLGSVVYEEKYGLSLDKTIAIRLCKAKAIDPGASVNVIIADAISAESNKESVIG